MKYFAHKASETGGELALSQAFKQFIDIICIIQISYADCRLLAGIFLC